MSRLYIGCQGKGGDLDEFFSRKISLFLHQYHILVIYAMGTNQTYSNALINNTRLSNMKPQFQLLLLTVLLLCTYCSQLNHK